MKQIPVSELTGPQLSEWCARGQEWEFMPDMLMWKMSNGHFIHIDKYQPHINGGQAMELIEKFNIAASPYYGKWKAWPVELGANGIQEGESAKIAICRAVVASVFGEFVEVEE